MIYVHQGDNPMKTIEWKEALEKASKELYKALNTFGPSETLKLLLEFSRDDLIVRELLTMYPSVVSLGDFLFGKPTVQLDGDHNTSEKPPKGPKKARSRKKNVTFA
jgi:hypothetical protein